MTIPMSPQAANLWADYLHRVEQALSSMETQDVHEVIGDLESHLDTELEGSGEELSVTQIQKIIACLGDPDSIADAAGAGKQLPTPIPAFAYVLTYGSLGLFLLALLVPIASPGLLVASGILARVAVQPPAVLSTSLRWASFPPLFAFYLLLAAVLLLWPLALVLPFFATGGLLEPVLTGSSLVSRMSDFQYWLAAWSLGVFASGLWLGLAGLLHVFADQLAAKLFYPFWRTQRYPVRKMMFSGAFVLMCLSVIVLLFILKGITS